MKKVAILFLIYLLLAACSPTPAETPVSLPESEVDPVAELVSTMTLREKICQLFVVYPESITGVSAALQAGTTTQEALMQYPVGGFLYDAKNMQSQTQLKQMLETTQSFSKIPLFLTCDEEGGRVARLMNTVGTTKLGPMLSYEQQGTATAQSNAATIGKDLKSCGFNMDFAPVADVWSNPENKVIGDRAYSRDYQTAAELVAAAVDGFHDAGIICTLKHFPGHGDTVTDSHYGSSYVEKTPDELQNGELLPFRAGIEAGADMVMLGHLIVPALDDVPAPFSYRITTELLRQELGFDGIIITDSLLMQAITEDYTDEEIAVKAVLAGVDMLLCPRDLDAAIEGLTGAVEDGTIAPQRLDESVCRILTLKIKYGLMQ